MSKIAQINPRKEGALAGAAWLRATDRADSVILTEFRQKANEIRIIDESNSVSELIRLNPSRNMLFELALQSQVLEHRVALGLSDAEGRRINWNPTIRELSHPEGSLATILPNEPAAVIDFLSIVLRGRINAAREQIAAAAAVQGIQPNTLGHAHMPPNVRRHFRGMLYRRGAMVTTFADGEAMGVHLSKRAQHLGLDCRDFLGFPEHWHVESWTIVYGSSKAPKPYCEAGISANELQRITDENLIRLFSEVSA